MIIMLATLIIILYCNVEHRVVADGSKVITIKTLQGDPEHDVGVDGGEWIYVVTHVRQRTQFDLGTHRHCRGERFELRPITTSRAGTRGQAGSQTCASAIISSEVIASYGGDIN